MRDENKIIMFDFGGVTELYDDGSGSTYNYKTVFVDAIKYATGIRACDNMQDEDSWVWEEFCSADLNDALFRHVSDFVGMRLTLGLWLCRLSSAPAEMAGTFTDRFIKYVQARNVMCPYRPEVVKAQMELKESCRIGAMTNISWMWSPRFHQLTDCICYDVIWESYKFGFCKPETAAYKSVETLCGLEGKQILLLDDSEENVYAAIENGWYARKVTANHVNIKQEIKAAAHYFLDESSPRRDRYLHNI